MQEEESPRYRETAWGEVNAEKQKAGSRDKVSKQVSK